MKKIHKGWYVLLMAIAVMLLLKWKFFPSQSGHTAARPPAGPVSVEVHVAAAADFSDHLTLSGSVLPAEAVDLQPEVAGKLLAFYVAEGGRVAAGQLIAKLNDADLQAQRLKVEAQLSHAALEAERNKNLWESRAIARQVYDESLLQQATFKADLALIDAQIAKTEIRAPFAGTIGNRNVSPGAMVSPSTVLARFYQTAQLKVETDVPAAYINSVRLNSIVGIKTANGTDATARIYSIEPGADPMARTYNIRAMLLQTGNLHPGDFVTVNIPLEAIRGAIRIPSEALVPVLKGQRVYVVRDGKASQVDVVTGNRDDSAALVLSGLKAGDSVITRGVLFVKPGVPVKISAPKPR